MRQRVLVVLGTRPEAIKMAPVILAFQNQPEIEAIVCVTAQHRQLLDEALAVFGICPHHDLDIMRTGQTLGQITAAVLNGLTPLINALCPARILVHGDTTTAFATALAGFYLNTPVGHVEAGLRTGKLDAPWPEEMNRRCVDILADLLWAPTEAAAATLLREGAKPGDVHVTGNTVVDALRLVTNRIAGDQELKCRLINRLPQLSPSRKVILVTGHRRESFDGGLAEICRALNQLADRSDTEIVWPVHPNPKVIETVRRELTARDNLHLIAPLDYLTFVVLMQRAHFIITDSGGIQEEAPSLAKPVLVTRYETERQEAIVVGTAKLVGTDGGRILAAASELLDDPVAHAKMTHRPNPFGDGHAAQRIVSGIVARNTRRGVRAA